MLLNLLWLNKAMLQNLIKKLEQDIPLRRRAKTEEVSNLVIYLASDDSSYSTGSQFVVDGGMISDL